MKTGLSISGGKVGNENNVEPLEHIRIQKAEGEKRERRVSCTLRYKTMVTEGGKVACRA